MIKDLTFCKLAVANQVMIGLVSERFQCRRIQIFLVSPVVIYYRGLTPTPKPGGLKQEKTFG